MSADNWAICPRCEAKRQAAIAAAVAEVVAAYGRMAIEEWDEKRTAVDALKAEEPRTTFREDYEFYGAEDGELCISYSGGCRECGLTHTFNHREAMDVKS